MDEMKLKLSTKFMRGIVSKLIARSIYKKYGYRVNVQLNDLDINRSVKVKYREALRNCGKEKDLSDAEKFIYGYYPKDKILKELFNIENSKTKKLNPAKK